MPVYTVSITVEAVVVAEDRRGALLDGREALREEIDNLSYFDVYAEQITDTSELPDKWDGSTLVYHDGHEDLTVDEALAREAGTGAS